MKYKVGEKFRDFELVEFITWGCVFGDEIWRATRRGKTFSIVISIGSAGRLEDQERWKQWHRQAVLTRQFPGLLGPVEVSVDRAPPYVVYEEWGKELRGKLEEGRMAPHDVVGTALGVLDVLARLHDKGLVHLEVRPANIYRRPSGEVALAVGQCISVNEVSSHWIRGVVSPLWYSAPELLVGHSVDGRADLYSVGVVLYRGLTGVLPFADSKMTDYLYRVLNEPVPAMQHRAPGLGVSAGLQKIVQKALERDPEDRFPSALHLQYALRAWANPPAASMLARLRQAIWR